MCGFYFIVFIEYLIPRKTLLDYINLFSPKGCKKNDKKYFKDKYGKGNVSHNFRLKKYMKQQVIF